jgi:hypothetical protein
MKLTKIAMFAAAAALTASSAYATPPINNLTLECNWGTLTMTAIKGGFNQGEHSSDPSGDGRGRGDADQPRVGLANVMNQGDLEATCEFIEMLLED